MTTTARIAKKTFRLLFTLTRLSTRFAFKKRSMPETLVLFSFLSGGIFGATQLITWAGNTLTSFIG